MKRVAGQQSRREVEQSCDNFNMAVNEVLLSLRL